MKKNLAVLVGLMLCLCLGCASAQVKGDVTLFHSSDTAAAESIQSIAAVGDTLYIGTLNGVYTWTPDMEAATMLDENMPMNMPYGGSIDNLGLSFIESNKKGYNRLIGSGNQLYGLNTTFGTVAPLSVTSEGLAAGEGIQLDWETLMQGEGENAYMRQVYGAVIQDGALYLLTEVTNEDRSNSTLYRYDLASGARTRLATTFIRSISAYKDGKLLGVLHDPENSWQDGKQVMSTLITVDALTGDIQTIMACAESQASGVQYDQANNAVYILGLSRIYGSVAGAPFEIAAYIPCGSPRDDMPVAVLAGGYYAAQIDYGTLIVRNMDPALKSNRVLQISGGYPNANYIAFTAAHPEIPVVFLSDWYDSGNTVAQRMISGGDGVDLFTVSYTGGFANLRDKGYCYDLSRSQIVVDAISKMYPKFTQELQRDGKIYAFPVDTFGNALAYAPTVLEEIGLTTDDLPKTLIEMIDFAVDWMETYGEEYPEYTLFDGVYNIRQQLFYQMYREYLGYYQMTGEELSFDTPLFHKLLAKLEEATPILSKLNPDGGNNGTTTSNQGLPTSLFQLNYSFMPGASAPQPGYALCPLPLDEGLEPVVMTSAFMYTINPYSRNVDLAMTFLEFYIENMPPYMKIILYPDENEPVENIVYLEAAATNYETAGAIEKQLAGLDEDEVGRRAGLEAQLEMVLADIEQAAQNRWEISPQQIEQYRSMIPYMIVPRDSAIYSHDSPETGKLIARYLDGELDSARFIKEYDRVIQMIIMESK